MVTALDLGRPAGWFLAEVLVQVTLAEGPGLPKVRERAWLAAAKEVE